nr:unnamed protein product [Callosobruchus analis]
MTPHKIQIIEDWLLGADAKCLYTTKQRHTESRETTVTSTLSETVKSELMINTTANENIDNLQNIEAAANPHPLDSTNHYRSENKQYPSTFVTQTTVATNEKNENVLQSIHDAVEIYHTQSSKLRFGSKGRGRKNRQETYKDKKDCCIFCDKDVTHFGRHLFTWHKGEIEVQRIMSYDNNSKERRHELLALRKRGNFIKNRTSTKLRPVKRVSLHNEREPKDYLPCQYCLGFYRKRRKQLKLLKTLIVSQWADEVSAQAATNLNEKKWNKQFLLPLTADLKKLNDYLQSGAETAYNELLSSANSKAYNKLKEILYTQIILLNRRRPAEVSQLKVQTYTSVNLDPQGGKSFIDGTKTLHKYASMCGVQNVTSITATSIRKHLATVMQLLNFSENDLEQLSKFMGHTLKTHCSFYRLSDNLYQTAKVSKLLLLSASGGIEKYKGKLLDDIEIDLSPIIEQSDQLLSITGSDNGISSEPHKTLHNPNCGSIPLTSQKRAPIIRQPWTIEQKNMIAQHFQTTSKKKGSNPGRSGAFYIAVPRPV